MCSTGWVGKQHVRRFVQPWANVKANVEGFYVDRLIARGLRGRSCGLQNGVKACDMLTDCCVNKYLFFFSCSVDWVLVTLDLFSLLTFLSIYRIAIATYSNLLFTL